MRKVENKKEIKSPQGSEKGDGTERRETVRTKRIRKTGREKLRMQEIISESRTRLLPSRSTLALRESFSLANFPYSVRTETILPYIHFFSFTRLLLFLFFLLPRYAHSGWDVSSRIDASERVIVCSCDLFIPLHPV